MAWYLFGKESKSERRFRELEETLLHDVKENPEADSPFLDGGDTQTSPLEDDGTPFVQLRGVWDNEKRGFKIELDWNAPFLSHAIPMGIDGETAFEVAASGILVLASQVLETEADRRANEQMKIMDLREKDDNR